MYSSWDLPRKFLQERHQRQCYTLFDPHKVLSVYYKNLISVMLLWNNMSYEKHCENKLGIITENGIHILCDSIMKQCMISTQQKEREACVFLSVYIFMSVHLGHLALNDSCFIFVNQCVCFCAFIVLNLLPLNLRTVTLVSCVKLSMTKKVLWLQYSKLLLYTTLSS